MASPIITFTWTKDGDQKSVNYTVTGGGAHTHITDSVPSPSTDRQVACAIPATGRLKAIAIFSDQALTLEANSGGAPAYTLNIAANSPLIWYTGSGITNPITANTTDFYVTQSSGSTATLDIYIEQDPTP